MTKRLARQTQLMSSVILWRAINVDTSATEGSRSSLVDGAKSQCEGKSARSGAANQRRSQRNQNHALCVNLARFLRASVLGPCKNGCRLP
jgi:hypothetical protein